jgi:putative protease
VHPVLADAGCRNTVFHARARSLAGRVKDMKQLGIRHFRVELLRESASQTCMLLDCYARILGHPEDARGALRQLRGLVPIRLEAAHER